MRPLQCSPSQNKVRAAAVQQALGSNGTGGSGPGRAPGLGSAGLGTDLPAARLPRALDSTAEVTFCTLP